MGEMVLIIFKDFIFKQSLNPTWDSNPQPQDQELHVPPTESARCPGKKLFLNDVRTLVIPWEKLKKN